MNADNNDERAERNARLRRAYLDERLARLRNEGGAAKQEGSNGAQTDSAQNNGTQSQTFSWEDVMETGGIGRVYAHAKLHGNESAAQALRDTGEAFRDLAQAMEAEQEGNQ